ncbi:hydantoinase/oxoprolinase family protein [Rhodococcus sp. NPDC057014]|uniref:hydantoinase/oxoprolinase family protein n=1 Tax=Rhodococcus sp. NPDC057014 TaxID=3346000 RepID=UPI0036437F2A
MSVQELMIGVDVGGTFTDCVIFEGKASWRAKAPTTSEDLGKGVLNAVGLAAQRRGLPLEELLPRVARFGLGTTAITNTLASRTGRSVGLLTTAGFEEMMLAARGAKVIDDEGWLHTPALLKRNMVLPVVERIDRNGEIVSVLDEDSVREGARILVEERGAEAIVISFLWSVLNPQHEQRAAAIVQKMYPDLLVVQGADLHPVAREYERTTYAVLNAYVSGPFAGIEQLETRLKEEGMQAPLLVVHSGGGTISVPEARRLPLLLALSGPAAGVSAAAALSESADMPNLLTGDMGGTSFDVSVVRAGAAARRARGDLMGVWTALPIVDVQAIGAGGGSLAWIDDRGMLRVGPKSAGAVPGPACYGRGGTQPTVTDALVVLGYISPEHFLGGGFHLDADAALQACQTLATRLNMTAQEVAWGIRELALSGMTRAMRGRIASLGLNPTTFAILSYGGSGSLFTPDIASSLHIPRVVVPDLASVLSASGAATANVRRERLRNVLSPMPVPLESVSTSMAELEELLRSDLTADGVKADDAAITFEADLRFTKQTHELSIAIPAGPFDDAARDRLLEGFLSEYTQRYGGGSVVLKTPIEVVSIRGIGVGAPVSDSGNAHSRATSSTETSIAVPDGTRAVKIDRAKDPVEVEVYDLSKLDPGQTLAGPALIDSTDTTIWVPNNWAANLRADRTLVLEASE